MLDKNLAWLLYSAAETEKNRDLFMHVFISAFGFGIYVKAFIGLRPSIFFVSVYM